MEPLAQFIPFSDDIVFFDAEFTSLDLAKGELMAVGMVSLDGAREMYFELDYNPDTVSPWTQEHVVPHLTGQKKSQAEGREMIRAFCGSSEPHLVATVNQWDMAFFHKFFRSEDEPINRIPIDFASMLFAMGLNPARTIDDEKEYFYESFGISLADYNLHNALDDTRLMRDLYVKLSAKSIH